MGALWFPLEAGRLVRELNMQRPFLETARLLLGPGCAPADAVVSTVVLLLQVCGGRPAGCRPAPRPQTVPEHVQG